MQETAVNSIGTVTGSERYDVRTAVPQPDANRQLGRVAANLLSGGSVINEFVIVSLVVVIILRASG